MTTLEEAAFGLGVGSRYCELDWITRALPVLAGEGSFNKEYIVLLNQLIGGIKVNEEPLISGIKVNGEPDDLRKQLLIDYADHTIPSSHDCWVWYDIGSKLTSCVNHIPVRILVGLSRRLTLRQVVACFQGCRESLPPSSAKRVNSLSKILHADLDNLEDEMLLDVVFGGDAEVEVRKWEENQRRSFIGVLLRRIGKEIRELSNGTTSGESAPTLPAGGGWWPENTPDPLGYFGPLTGFLKELAAWTDVSEPTLKRMCKDGGVWVRKKHRISYEIFYRSESEYKAAKKRSESEDNTQT